MVLVSAVLASIITLFGVMAQNLFETRRNSARLKHEAQTRSEEREITARREVYLRAAEEYSARLHRLGEFSDPSSLPAPGAFPMDPIAESSGKLHLVATWPTVQKAQLASECFDTGMRMLSQMRATILTEQGRANEREAEAHSLAARRDAIVKRIEDHPPSSEEFMKLETTLDELQMRLTELRDELDTSRKEIDLARYELARKAQEARFEYAERWVEFTLAIRRELKMPIDEEKYRKMMLESLRRSRSTTEDALSDMRAKLGLES